MIRSSSSMDEGRTASFYAPKKLFKRRIDDSETESSQSNSLSTDSQSSKILKHIISECDIDSSSANPAHIFYPDTCRNQIKDGPLSFEGATFNSHPKIQSTSKHSGGLFPEQNYQVHNHWPPASLKHSFSYNSYDEIAVSHYSDKYNRPFENTNNLSLENNRIHRTNSIEGLPNDSNGIFSKRFQPFPDVTQEKKRYSSSEDFFIDNLFIKSEPDDSEYYFDSLSKFKSPEPINGLKSDYSFEHCSFPQKEAINLTKPKPDGHEQLKKALLDSGSTFFEKFSVKSLRQRLAENNDIVDEELKTPIPYKCIKTEHVLPKFSWSDIKLEAMDDSLLNDPSLTTLGPIIRRSFDNQVSSTNNFNSGSAVNNTDVDQLDSDLDLDIFKTSLPPENVNKVTSSDSRANLDSAENVSHRKQGKKWMKGDMICQVCGDKAAGFYCGAFACEACKKFFMRSCRSDKTKYVCLREKKCQITTESRVQCQFCRLQKCLSLNMYSPGSDVKKENVGDIPCRVCGAPSSGFHFGALTCEGCKGFFRRMAKERELGKYRCSKLGSCEINMSTRNLCKSCRYKKCIDSGMSIEGSRIGRQPNAVKYAISLEVKNQNGENVDEDKPSFTLEDLSKSVASDDSATPEKAQSKRPNGGPYDCDNNSPPKKFKLQMLMTREKYEEIMKWLQECDKDLRNITLPKNDCEHNILTITNVSEIWEEIVKPFYYHSSIIIKFAKKCQPFRKVSLEDQVKMLQQALYPVSILNHSRYYILETKQYSYFGWDVTEREHIWKYFPFYRVLGEHFENTGDNVKLLGLDDNEFTILSALVLLNPDVPGLSDKEKIRQLQAEILDFLEYYSAEHYPDQPSRYGLILVRLSELNFYAFQHLEGVREMLRVYPFLTMPQLYREMFINL